MALFGKNYSNKSDEELMSMLAQGGQSAFDELYRRYSKPMLNFFYRLLNFDKEKAEDMLHDLFLKIIEKTDTFDCSRTFSSWFYTLAGNMVKNEYRNRKYHSDYIESQQYSEIYENGNIGIDSKMFQSRLVNELNKMDEDSQLLFKLRFSEEMSVKQIAEIMECPEGTVKSRLFYLTRQLSKKLIAYKPELD